ncbi:MAG: aldehyde ferredoxin oxidoreductase family protein [bacterium]|nr:aldehyde ferredoxin oxidoreductase family protein [bacterium]
MKGYSGKILHVDLSKGTFDVEEPDEIFYRKYVGGACLGAYYLLKGMGARIDPFSPENMFVVSISSITGAPISGNARHCVTTKSPLTGTIASSEAGGFWGPELKFAGFDAIVIAGKAEKPVYLWIHDGEYELRDASHLWGKMTGDVQDAIRNELGDEKIMVAQIGPAGENKVLYAGIANELKHFNGRNGMGAVMGSKNLKAIAVRGTQKPEFHDTEIIKKMAKYFADQVKQNDFYSLFRLHGTTLNVEWNAPAGGLPTKNWTAGNFEQEDKLRGETYYKEMMDKPGTCWACAQQCKRDLKAGITKPYTIDPRYGGPEYETIGMCGSNLLIADLHAISRTNEIASQYGMDTISLGGTIGFVMECFEKGILTAEDTGGLEVRFGDSEALVTLAELTGKREGFGDLVADGTYRLAKKLGPEAERIAVHVKGKEFPAHMPHTKGMLALAYACNSFGPDHVSSEHDPCIAGDPVDENLQGFGFYETVDPVELNFEKSKLLAYSQRYYSAIDSFSVCGFCFNTWSILSLSDLVAIVNATTGWKYTLVELMLLGERRLNMMRAFNQREGFDAKDDMLPERLFEDGLTNDGPSAGRTVDREKFLTSRKYYYGINGWDLETGNPTEIKLRELGLGWVAELV